MRKHARGYFRGDRVKILEGVHAGSVGVIDKVHSFTLTYDIELSDGRMVRRVPGSFLSRIR